MKSLSLRMKLLTMIVVIGIIVSGVNIYQTIEVEKVSDITQELVNDDMARLDTLRQARFENARLFPVIETGDSSATSARVAPLTSALQEKLAGYAGSLQKTVTSYIAQSHQDTDHDLSQQKLTSLSEAAKNVAQTTDSLTSNDPKLLRDLNNSTVQMDTVINSLIKDEQAGIAKQDAAIRQATERVQQMFIVITLGVTIASVLIGFVLMTSISRSLSRIRRGAVRIANGDFSTPIKIEAHDELGELGGTINSMADRLRDSYKRLAVEQQRDEAILQNMGEGLIATDEKGNILLINHVAVSFLGLKDIESAVGKPINEAFDLYSNSEKNEKPIPKDKRPVFVALTSGEPVNDVFAFHGADDKKVLMDTTATPILLDGKVVGAISVMRDVTKEKEIDRMKTEFISLASHQLRTPLSAIKWFTEMLISGDAGKLTDDQLEFAKNIDDSTSRMIALVNALLNISRIESGRIMIVPKPTDLRELVAGIVNDLKAKTEEKKQTLIISVHDDLPLIPLDPRLIGQVYLNLLTNAVKYTQEGGEVSVFISRKDDQIISQVSDNGYGIPKEQQGRIFQKFFRAANAVKVETDGTGLGLYLIKSVVESSGGKIWFESEEGKGTTFWFSIPVSGMKAKEGEVTLDV